MKLELTSQEILDNVFPLTPRGYDSLAVDEFLDQILRDYRRIESNVLVTKEEMAKKDNQIKQLETEVETLKIELKKFQKRFSGIKENENVSMENIDLVKRIRTLETYLYRIGVNPTTIK